MLNRKNVLDGHMYACNIMTCHGVDVLGGTFIGIEYGSKNFNPYMTAHIRATMSRCETLELCVIVGREMSDSNHFVASLVHKCLGTLPHHSIVTRTSY